MNSVYIDRLDDFGKRIVAAAFPSYNGRKFEVTPAESFNPNVNNWDGGSRTYQVAVSRDGKVMELPTKGNIFVGFAENSVPIPEGVIIVEHRIFCGKDLGINFLIRPDEMPESLKPKKEEFDSEEKTVLFYTRSRKSSYNGRNRHQMSQSDRRWHPNIPRMTAEDWQNTVERLIQRGMMKKNKSLTTKGKNAASNLREQHI